ncbi:hypothetical protein [Ornithinimicrobium cerasi]|uniref:Uncharacterized protein n=1 Tax=Ornithinimicrobium cerasi TaxID=2248773 RepID=A0A285VRK1_9MICO|nr:hypothetical protein [Ornithinimicrobium cerasi]SOC56573.1 hypothetical protein SAMN05421879_10839 [Ornithinimicrobium cerasi]
MAGPPDVRSRVTAARSVAVLLALVALFIMMGLIDLLTLPGWVDQRYEWEVPLEASWGALFTFFLAGGYVWVALFPRAPWPALVQLAISASALLVSAGAGADPRPLVVALGVVGSGLVLWLLLGRPPAPRLARPAVAWAPMTVALLGFPLWLPYTIEALARSRSGELGTITQGIEHWPVQGAVAVAVLLASLTVSLWEGARPLLRVAIAPSAVYIGMAELAHPDRAGAMGSLPWGVGVTLWGLLVALVVVPRSRTGNGAGHADA